MDLHNAEPTSTQSPRQRAAKDVIVRAYGARILDVASSEPMVRNVFRKMNQFWNALVAIDREAAQRYQDALKDSDSELARLKEQEASDLAALESALEARNKDRQRARSKKTEQSAALGAAYKEATAALKATRLLIRAQKLIAKEKARPLVAENELLRRQAVKAAMAESGLWWAHSEMVLDKYQVARSRAMREGATLRFHRYEGEGSFGIRFTGEVALGMDRIFAGSTSMLKLRDPTDEELGRMVRVKPDGSRRVIAEMRIGNKSEDGGIPTAKFLVTLHAGMEFPKDMPLRTVRLTRTMHVTKGEWKIVFMFSREKDEEAPLPELPNKAVGVDFGFRLVKGEGGEAALRICTAFDGHTTRQLILDAQWISRMKRASDIQSRLDLLCNEFWLRVREHLNKEFLESLDEDSWLAVIAGKTKRAKRAYCQLLITLCDAHAQAGHPLGESVAQEMAEFKTRALDLWTQTHHIKRRAVDHRKHLFRNFASALVKEAGMIALVDTDFSDIARRTYDDEELAAAARRNRMWAAPSELRLAIKTAAQREKVELFDADSTNITRTCSECGHVHGGQIEDLTHVCQGCGAVWDQDVNAAKNARALGISG
jgi:hypothetical protein